jgi:hypothetical protein
MSKFETWLTGLLLAALAVLMPMAALEPVSAGTPAAAAGIAVTACDDGSAHLVMGCASILL